MAAVTVFTVYGLFAVLFMLALDRLMERRGWKGTIPGPALLADEEGWTMCGGCYRDYGDDAEVIDWHPMYGEPGRCDLCGGRLD